MADGQETKKPEDATPKSSLIDTSGDIKAALAARDAGQTGPKVDAPTPVLDTSGDIKAALAARDAGQTGPKPPAPTPVIDTSGDIKAALAARDAAQNGVVTAPEAAGVRNADAVTVDQKLDADTPATPASAATATAPAPDDKKNKADEPQVEAPAMETEEQATARKKKEAEANQPAQPQQAAPQLTEEELAKKNAPLTDEALRNSKFFVDFNTKHLPVLNEIWGVGDVDPALKHALGETGEIRKHKNGLLFDLPNGHTIEWHANLGGAEFIGMPRKSSTFDSTDAHAVVAASKSRGWQAITVYGTVEQKEMLWLEAQRQGIKVSNFEPREGSPILDKWREEAQAKADDQVVGISASEHGPMNLPKSMFVDTEALKTDAPKTDAPKSETPKTDAPKAETPPAQTATQGAESFDEFLDRKISAAKGDPDLQKGLLAIREGIKNNAIPMDADGTAQLKSALGADDGADRAKYQAAARELEGRVKDLKLPSVEVKAATPDVAAPKVDTPKAETPKETTTTKPKALAV